MFVVSAKSRVELFGAPTFLIKSFFAENYWATLTNTTYQGFMLNSIIIADIERAFWSPRCRCSPPMRCRAIRSAARRTSSSGRSPTAWRRRPCFLLPLFLLYTQVFVIGDWKMFDTRIGLILLYLRLQPALRHLDDARRHRRHPA